MIIKYRRAGKIQPNPEGGYDLAECRARLADTLGAKTGGSPRRDGGKTVASPAPPPAAKRQRVSAEDLSKADLEKHALAERVRRDRLRNDREERNLVDAKEVESAIDARFGAERDAWLDWPDAICAEFAAEAGVAERLMHDLLAKYVRRHLADRSSLPVK